VTYSYSRRGGRRFVEKHALRVTEVMVDLILSYSIPKYVPYRYRQAWYFRRLPRPLFHLLERRFGWHLCLKGTPCR
jgi:hypothetical protein